MNGINKFKLKLFFLLFDVSHHIYKSSFSIYLSINLSHECISLTFYAYAS